MPSLFELALTYTKAGISIIPISPDGTVGPTGGRHTLFDCSDYIRHRIATPDELRDWFWDGGEFGLAAVHGRISGGLECLDLAYAAVVKLFRQLVTLQGGADLLQGLPAAQSTVEGRTRLYYRCPNPARGYKRLAHLEVPSKPGLVTLQVLGFVHGEGSWTALPGLSAAFCDFDAYEWVNLDLTQAPSIAKDHQLQIQVSLALKTLDRLRQKASPVAGRRHDAGDQRRRSCLGRSEVACACRSLPARSWSW